MEIKHIWPEHIYNPITAMGVLAMFTFSWSTLGGKHCRHPIAVMGVVDTFGPYMFDFHTYQEGFESTGGPRLV